jgi:hypothetical protein
MVSGREETGDEREMEIDRKTEAFRDERRERFFHTHTDMRFPCIYPIFLTAHSIRITDTKREGREEREDCVS